MSSLRAFRRDYQHLQYEIPEIVSHYRNWVNDDRYMIMTRLKDLENETFAAKSAKRGNDVYRLRVRQRFEGLSSMAEELAFFNPMDRGSKKTKALWVTLTYDTKLCSFRDAWIKIGVELNRFFSFVRKHFGKLSSIRVFESFGNGYPHVHAILLFESTWFKVFRDKKGQFRVREKNVLARGWHSNIDVKAMCSLARGFSYLKKYLLKNINAENADSKALVTLALCWAFMKRAFSVSGQFRRMLSELIRQIRSKRTIQLTLTGEVLEEEKFHLGFRREIGFSKLDMTQIVAVEEYLSRPRHYGF